MKGWYYLASDGALVGSFNTETMARDSAAADEAEWDRTTKVLVEDAAKLAKAEVDYSPGKGADRCACCVHYYRNTCQLVEGEIDPAYWCKKFEATVKGQDAGTGMFSLWVRNTKVKNSTFGKINRTAAWFAKRSDAEREATKLRLQYPNLEYEVREDEAKGKDMKIATDPPVSEAQRRAMWSAKSGNSNIGIPASVGKEFANADPGGKLPAKAKDAERMFPSFTLADLKKRVGSETDPARKAKIEAEIKARESGASKPRITPQIGWGKDTALDFLHIRDLNKVPTQQLREFARRYEQMNYADKSRNGKAAYESVQAELQRRGTSEDAKPPTAAGTMYVAPDGDILMMRRSGAGDKAGHWAFPGGRIEADESPQDAARREAKEEMGDHAPDGDSKLLHVGDTFHTFAQPVDEKFTPELNEEHTGFCWAPFNQLPSPLHPGVADMLRDCAIPDAAADMTPEDWQGLTGGLLKFLSEEAGEPEHAEDDASQEQIVREGRRAKQDDTNYVRNAPKNRTKNFVPAKNPYPSGSEAAKYWGMGYAQDAKPSFKQFARPRFKQFGNPKSLKAFS